MTSNGIIGLLRQNGPEIRDRFRVRRLAVFGSVARMQEKPESDVDVLVEFEGEPRFDQFMDLKFYLEEMLKRRVDLVTPQALKPRMARVVQQEAVNVAWTEHGTSEDPVFERGKLAKDFGDLIALLDGGGSAQGAPPVSLRRMAASFEKAPFTRGVLQRLGEDPEVRKRYPRMSADESGRVVRRILDLLE